LIKEQLAPQYGTVAAERGRGIFGRMKVRSLTASQTITHLSLGGKLTLNFDAVRVTQLLFQPNMTFIRDSAHTVFEPLNAGTRIAFAGSVGEVQSELLDGIKRILREISLFFIGENSLSMRKWWSGGLGKQKEI
jgi:hypothetical protein